MKSRRANDIKSTKSRRANNIKSMKSRRANDIKSTKSRRANDIKSTKSRRANDIKSTILEKLFPVQWKLFNQKFCKYGWNIMNYNSIDNSDKVEKCSAF